MRRKRKRKGIENGKRKRKRNARKKKNCIENGKKQRKEKEKRTLRSGLRASFCMISNRLFGLEMVMFSS